LQKLKYDTDAREKASEILRIRCRQLTKPQNWVLLAHSARRMAMQDAGINQHANESGYLLGDWQVFPDTGVLIKAGFHIHAEPKVMSVLECLMQAGGRLVTRDELIDKVWTHVVVNDEVLTRAVSELRTLLGDVSRERRYIVTVPKRGYKLVMPALPMAGPVDSTPLQVGHSRSRRYSCGIRKTAGSFWISARQLLGKPVALAGCLAVSSMLAFSLWTASSEPNSQASIPVQRADLDHGMPVANQATTLQAESQRFQISEAFFGSVDWMAEYTTQSVLVTPLTAITDDEQTRSFAAGLSEDLRHAIFRQTDLQVVYQLPENHLENTLILSGSVRIHDQLTRVNLQLVDAVTSRLLWSRSFECAVDALLSVQTQIARQAGRDLQLTLSRQA